MKQKYNNDNLTAFLKDAKKLLIINIILYIVFWVLANLTSLKYKGDNVYNLSPNGWVCFLDAGITILGICFFTLLYTSITYGNHIRPVLAKIWKILMTLLFGCFLTYMILDKIMIVVFEKDQIILVRSIPFPSIIVDNQELDDVSIKDTGWVTGLSIEIPRQYDAIYLKPVYNQDKKGLSVLNNLYEKLIERKNKRTPCLGP